MKGVLWKAVDLATVGICMVCGLGLVAGGEVPQMYGAVVPLGFAALGIVSMVADLLGLRLPGSEG